MVTKNHPVKKLRYHGKVSLMLEPLKSPPLFYGRLGLQRLMFIFGPFGPYFKPVRLFQAQCSFFIRLFYKV